MKIVADIGGTKTRIAGSSDLIDISEPIIYDTPKVYREGIQTLIKSAQEVAKDERIDAIQIGIRGIISRESGSISDAFLSDWSDKPLAHDLRVEFSIPYVGLENDVATVAMGEAHFGAGRESLILAYFSISTGVNAWRVVDGKIDRSMRGFEVGGQYVNIDPTITLEEMVSGTAIQKQFGVHPRELGKDNPLWDELAELTAYGVHNTILHWSPDRIVMGGSMLNDIGISVPKVAENVKKILRKFPYPPEIVHASLGDVGGLWGALAILRQNT